MTEQRGSHGGKHCYHAPACVGVDPPDDRDPLGCCNCGTREAEKNRPGIPLGPQARGGQGATMNTTNPAPGGTGQSPTGYAWLPQWVVKTLLVLALVATAWQAAELYDFEAGTWHPERAPAFILALVATAGVASQGVRRGATMAIAIVLGLTLTSTSALARDWTPVTAELPETLAPSDSSPLDSLSLGVSAGWSFERKALAVDLVGAVHVAEVGRWTLSVGFSGALLQALRELAAGTFSPGDLSGAIGLYALVPARPGAGLRVGLGALFEGTMAGKAGCGLRAVVFW